MHNIVPFDDEALRSVFENLKKNALTIISVVLVYCYTSDF